MQNEPASQLFKICIIFLIGTSVGLQTFGPANAGPPQSNAPGQLESPPEPPTPGEPVMAGEFNGDLRSLPQVQGATRTNPTRTASVLAGPGPQSALASGPVTGSTRVQSPAPNMPDTDITFRGLDHDTWGDGWPPDASGDVGPNHYIQAVDTSVGIFNKLGTLLAAFTVDSLWSGIGSTSCNGNNQGNVAVLYDRLSNRWIFADYAWIPAPIAPPFYECFAISKTSNPVTGGWWLYAVRTDDTAHPWLAESPRIGFWPDGIYMSANMFDYAQSTCPSSPSLPCFRGVRAWAFNRTDMESGAALRSLHADLSSIYYGLLPGNSRGTPPPAGTPNYFVSNAGTTNWGLNVWKFHADWITPANTTFSGPAFVSSSLYDPYNPVPASILEQGGEPLDSLGDTLMAQNQYRNINGTESLWLAHTIGSGGVTGIRWYQLDVTGGTIAGTPVQLGDYQPDLSYRWLPSLAVDRIGDMAIGFSVSSSTMFPAIRYAGRLFDDPPNLLANGENEMIAGTGAQLGGLGHWGNYSAMSVDPVNDCTFWYTNEYYDTTGNNWQTLIGSFHYLGCHLFADVPVSTKEWMEPWIDFFYYAGITTGCNANPLMYCPENKVTRAEMAVFLLRAKNGAGYAPPAATHIFSDMPIVGKEWMEPWVDEYFREGLTTGCNPSPLQFCPENNVTRAEMAVFVLRSTHFVGWQPPGNTGVFGDVPVPGKEWMQPWIEEYYHEGITSGCGVSPLIYCPEANVTRAEMAVFIGRVYHLYP